MNSVFFTELAGALPALPLRSNVPYRELTSLGSGGVIPCLAEPNDDIELSSLLKYTSEHQIPVFILGGGSNVVGMDSGFSGVVIRLAQGDFTRLSTHDSFLVAGAGVRLAELARFAIEQSSGSFAKLAGIPGTVGGAVRMNAGANGDDFGHHVVQVCGCRMDGSFYYAEEKDLVWDYRCGAVPEDVVITCVMLRGECIDANTERTALADELASRRRREPQGRTAGCMFRNPGMEESAGRLIDQAGLKNAKVGSAQVSAEHANYIVNRENAAERDVVDLMIQIRRTVAEKFGLYLIPEVVFINPESRKRIFDAVPSPKVLLFKGGASSEREVSLRSGAAVSKALRNAGYTVFEYDIHECALPENVADFDVVYIILHGGFGEDGRIQKLLEERNIRFVGSGSAASKLVMDKIASKKMMDQCGIPTAAWAILTPENRELPEKMTFPLVLKAPNEGSTVGIELVKTAADFPAALEREFQFDREILAEQFIEGVEITVPVVNGQVLPAVEIHSPHGFYDYDAKYVYKNGHTEYFCPVIHASKAELDSAAKFALAFFHAAECRDILRVDFIIGRDGVPYVLEGNSLPGCTETSLVPKAAKVAGISFERMTSSLVQAALRR